MQEFALTTSRRISADFRLHSYARTLLGKIVGIDLSSVAPRFFAAASRISRPKLDSGQLRLRRLSLWSRRVTAAASCCMGLVCNLPADTNTVPIGTHFDTLTTTKRVYQDVTVRQVSTRSLTVLQGGGLVSIPLRELTPEWQARFGYSAAAESDADAKLALARSTNAARVAKQRVGQIDRTGDIIASKFEQIVQNFGEAPELKAEVDLRPRFFELALRVKDQGRRPSCSVFAVVSALEFQNAELTGTPEKFSEEYLIWATRQTTQRIGSVLIDQASPAGDQTREEDFDDGFALPEVVAALRAYGIPLQSIMPNALTGKMKAIAAPPVEVIHQARANRRVFVHRIPGRDGATRVSNLLHALNAGVPVAIGLRWPNYRSSRSGFISEQKPVLDYAHAVTLVGYHSESGRLEDAVFLFKNSWGQSWGQGGYGRVTYHYLQEYLLDAILLEVQRGGV